MYWTDTATRWPCNGLITPRCHPQTSHVKAYTAVSFGFGTHLWQQRLADKPHLLSGLTQQPDMVLFGGGLPVTYNGQLVGAVGVSGASEAQDQACAAAGIAALPELQSQ
nr:heme-binding protein [Aliamphritea spongicola]